MKKFIKVKCYFFKNGLFKFISVYFYYDLQSVLDDIDCNRLPGNYWSINDSYFNYK